MIVRENGRRVSDYLQMTTLVIYSNQKLQNVLTELGRVCDTGKLKVNVAKKSSHCSSKAISSSVLQGSCLSPTLFLLFISDISTLSTVMLIYDSNLNFSTSFPRLHPHHKLNVSWRDAMKCLTSDFYVISERGRANLVLFSASITEFLHYQVCIHSHPDKCI